MTSKSKLEFSLQQNLHVGCSVYGKWYIGATTYESGICCGRSYYIHNDCTVHTTTRNIIDNTYPGYYDTQEEAQAVLDKYNSLG